MRRLSLNRSEPATKSGQNIPKNRCRTTIPERMVETLAELPFIGNQVVFLSHDQAARSGPASMSAVCQDFPAEPVGGKHRTEDRSFPAHGGSPAGLRSVGGRRDLDARCAADASPAARFARPGRVAARRRCRSAAIACAKPPRGSKPLSSNVPGPPPPRRPATCRRNSDVGIAQQPLGYEVGMLDDVGRMRNEPRYQHLAGRQRHILPHVRASSNETSGCSALF